jgi:membrane protein
MEGVIIGRGYKMKSRGPVAMMERIVKKSRTIRLLTESLTEFGSENGTLLAASVSYYLLLSLFPLALAIVYIVGSFPQSPYTQEQIIQGLAYMLPVSRELIAGTVNSVAAARGAIGVLALIGLIWGGTSFFTSIRASLNAAWGLRKPAPLLKGQLINLSMLIGAAILLFLSVLITAFLSTVSEQVVRVAGEQLVTRSVLERILANVLASTIAFIVFLLVYRFVPSVRPKWKDIWIGALAAAIFFEIIKVIFLIYLRVFNPYNLIYGSIGALIAFLIWTYLSALIFLFIAKVMHVNLEMRSREKA